jgi:hypothetical protein
MEGNIQTPVQLVFDTPVTTNQLAKGGSHGLVVQVYTIHLQMPLKPSICPVDELTRKETIFVAVCQKRKNPVDFWME